MSTLTAHRCTLVRGDCKKALSSLAAGSVTLHLVDPPYGAQLVNRAGDSTEWDVAWSQQDWNAIVGEVARTLRPGGHLLVFSGGKTLFRMHAQIVEAYKKATGAEPGFYHMVWQHDSNDSGTTHSHTPRSKFENINVYYSVGGGRHAIANGCLNECDYHHTGQSNVWFCPKDNCRAKEEDAIRCFFREAPGAHTFDYKPLPLLERLVRHYSARDGLVVDFCMRHGGTGYAALRARRRFLGVELDEKAFKAARDRLLELGLDLGQGVETRDERDLVAPKPPPATANPPSSPNSTPGTVRVRLVRKNGLRPGSRVLAVRGGRRGESGTVLFLRGDKAKVRGDDGRPFSLQAQAAFCLAPAAAGFQMPGSGRRADDAAERRPPARASGVCKRAVRHCSSPLARPRAVGAPDPSSLGASELEGKVIQLGRGAVVTHVYRKIPSLDGNLYLARRGGAARLGLICISAREDKITVLSEMGEAELLACRELELGGRRARGDGETGGRSTIVCPSTCPSLSSQ